MSVPLPASSGAPDRVRDLRDRRPGHAAMQECLRRVDRRHEPALVPPEATAWYSAALGELAVGSELARLPDGWHALHALPVGSRGGDVDHLVIGPGGVFVLATERHPDAVAVADEHTVWVAGVHTPSQRAALAQADRVRRALAPILDALPEGADAVHATLVLVDVRDLRYRGEQSMPVLTLAELVPALLDVPAVLPVDVVQDLVVRAAQPGTWSAGEAVLAESDPTLRFLALKLPLRTRSPRGARVHAEAPLRAGEERPRILRPPAATETADDGVSWHGTGNRYADAALVLGVLAFALTALPLIGLVTVPAAAGAVRLGLLLGFLPMVSAMVCGVAGIVRSGRTGLGAGQALTGVVLGTGAFLVYALSSTAIA